ncbi:hypothetical protein DSECCO2_549470 [anaerobic digester metagenome]
MARVLLGRCIPITKVPEPGSHVTGAVVGELDCQRSITFGWVCGEGCCRRLQNGDVINLSLDREPISVARVQGDRVGAGARVGVSRVLHGRGVAVTEVPEPGSHIPGAPVGELHREGRITLGRVCGEGRRRRLQNGETINLGLDREPVSVARVQADGVGAGSFVGVNGVLLSRFFPVPEVPEPGCDVAGAVIGELDGQGGVTFGWLCGEGCCRRFQNGYSGRGAQVVSASVARVQDDVVDPDLLIGVNGALFSRGVVVPKVPVPGCDGSGALIGEPDRERYVALNWIRFEYGRRRSQNGDRGRGTQVVSVLVARVQGDVVDAGVLVDVARVPVGRSVPITKVPDPRGHVPEAPVGELDVEGGVALG